MVSLQRLQRHDAPVVDAANDVSRQERHLARRAGGARDDDDAVGIAEPGGRRRDLRVDLDTEDAELGDQILLGSAMADTESNSLRSSTASTLTLICACPAQHHQLRRSPSNRAAGSCRLTVGRLSTG